MKKYLLSGIVLALMLTILAACSLSRNPSSKSKPETEEGLFVQDYEKGILTETSFESEFIGIRFDLPDEMIMSTQAEMDEMTQENISPFNKENSELILDYTSAPIVYEMATAGKEGTPVILISVTKLQLSRMTETQFLDNIKKDLKLIENLDYQIEDEYTELEFAGETVQVLTATISVSGMEIQQQYLVRKKGNRMITFMLTWLKEDPESAQYLLDQFKPYRKDAAANLLK